MRFCVFSPAWFCGFSDQEDLKVTCGFKAVTTDNTYIDGLQFFFIKKITGYYETDHQQDTKVILILS